MRVGNGDRFDFTKQINDFDRCVVRKARCPMANCGIVEMPKGPGAIFRKELK
jgi:hypothetical protein